jgi:ferrous iron transport protein A
MTSSNCIEQLVELRTLTAGKQGVLHALKGGHEFCSRMANFGFTPGASLRVLQNRGHGPILVFVRGTLVALGSGEAAKVIVKKVGDDER